MIISVVTGVWKRPEVFKLFAKGIKAIPYPLNVIVVGSEKHRSRKLVEDEGFTYIEHKNRPLSNKMNAAMQAAKGSDYVICMGSDDIISPDLFSLYYRYMVDGYEAIGLTDLYFYELETGKAIYWGGYSDYRKGKTVGAARCISGEVLDWWEWKAWDDNLNKYLDSSMKLEGLNLKKISLKETNLLAVDIKSKTNITPFKLWDNSTYIDSNIITDEFSYIL
jgi:glycosyltransferase involved in cell wall biosynthesis